jgi:hypothetical protein
MSGTFVIVKGVWKWLRIVSDVRLLYWRCSTGVSVHLAVCLTYSVFRMYMDGKYTRAGK